MDLGLKGKRALVFAGTSGLGRATAEALAAEGARVVINGRSEERAQQVASEIKDTTGGAVRGVGGDVSSAAEIERVFKEATGWLGGLDALLLNAGGPPAGGFEELSDEQWHAAFELTLMSVVRGVRLALPHLREAGGGAVLAVGSSSIRQGVAGLTLSNAIRPGVNALLKELSATLGGDGIRVNYLSPGRIVTPRLDSLDEQRAAQEGVSVEEVRAETSRSVPLGRLGRAEEFGRVAAFLLSDAASYVTGQSVLVDGGLITSI